MNKVFLIFCAVTTLCHAVSYEDQINHINERNQESYFGLPNEFKQYYRRSLPYQFTGTILGVPSAPRHLPEAEAILPGHTLIRPAFGMLKSAVKFPHRELENGAGVNGNIDNLGITWNGHNERLQYSGFRRNANKWRNTDVLPDYLRSRYSSNDVAVFSINGSNEYECIVAEKCIGLDRMDSSKSSEEVDMAYVRYLRLPEKSKAYRRSYIVNSENDDSDFEDLNVKKYTDAISKVYRNLVASTINILQDTRSDKRRYDFERYQSSSSIEENGTRIGKSGNAVENWEKIKSKVNNFVYIKDNNNMYNSNEELNGKGEKNKLWNLQMTGDHMNVSPNAPYIHEFVSKSLFEKPKKYWTYWGEARHQKPTHGKLYKNNRYLLN